MGGVAAHAGVRGEETVKSGLAVVLVALALVTAVSAQPAGESGPFRVVWQAETSRALGPVVQGSVYNDSIYQVRHVQLRIQCLDGSTVREEIYKFVLGDIAPGSRGIFTARVPAAPQYQVHVVSYERIGAGQ
jgi:hypothetical protein